MTSRIFILFGLLFVAFNAVSLADGIMKTNEIQGAHETQPLPNEFCCLWGPGEGCLGYCNKYNIRGAHLTQPLPNEFCCLWGPGEGCLGYCNKYNVRGAHLTQPLPNEFCCLWGPGEGCLGYCNKYNIRGDAGELYYVGGKDDIHLINGRKLGYGGQVKMVTNN